MQQLPACQPVQENSPREERELSQLVQAACAVLPAHQPQEAVPKLPNTAPFRSHSWDPPTLTSLVFPHL